MDRAAFERLVRETAYRPSTVQRILAELDLQMLYHAEPRREGLEDLAHGLAQAFAGFLGEAELLLSRLTRQHREQPLTHYYLFAVQRQAGDAAAAKESLSNLGRIDPGDPMVDLLRLHFEGKPIPGITEEVRLANIRKFAGTPFLKNPYQLAVRAIFEEIRDREHARVLDVGVGSGAQMGELLGLLQRQPHRLRRLEIVGLDFVQEFLETAGRNILARAQDLAGRVAISYRPVQGRIEALDGAALRAITSEGPLHAANASIALHEVPGEGKGVALWNLRALAPRRFVLVEWNYCLENVLPETSVEFLFNVRRVAAAMIAALREAHPLAEAREVVRGWLTQAGGQLTCPAGQRQECFLDAASWKALLEASGFVLRPPDPNLLRHAGHPDRAGLGAEPWYLAAYQDRGAAPIVLLEGLSGQNVRGEAQAVG